MKKIKAFTFVFLISLGICFGVTAKELGSVVIDSDMDYFETTDKELSDFVRQFKNNKFPDRDIEFIHEACRKNNISVLWALARIQTEQGLVVNWDNWRYEIRRERLFSYGLSILDGSGKQIYLGFENQVTNALQRMRSFSEEWTYGKNAHVDFYGMVSCRNRSSYSLHRYNCRWGAASNFGVYNIGNELFVSILRDFQKRWLSIAKAD